jgi:hypothetical protein
VRDNTVLSIDNQHFSAVAYLLASETDVNSPR